MNTFFEKARHFCDYQERCHLEVQQRLFDWGLKSDEIGTIMSQLIEEGFLNEERFARAFCRGKFNLKKWGRLKIVRELKSRQISEYCIWKGLEEIEEEKYLQTLEKLVAENWKKYRGLTAFTRKGLTAKFLAGKGYESDLIWGILKNKT